ncbi:MAG: tetratricopeptide repeat protein, partial [Flavobacteriales bacterium]
QICAENQAFDLGLELLTKLIKQGKTSAYYRFALEQSLELKTKQLESFPEQSEDLTRALKADFEQYFLAFPNSAENIKSQYLYANFTSRFLGNDAAAISILEQALTLPANSKVLAECKLLLGDILLINNRLWESLLYYKQVDLDFEHSVFGHEARYRRAKVSFYQGDFQWAKDQLDILKQSTSKLIANNAMELSLLIQESLNLDSTTLALELYARADLLSLQKRYTEADDLLNGLIKLSSNQILIDDALLLKAKLAEDSKQYKKAIDCLSQLLTLEDDLLKDNALFQLANLYEHQLKNYDKAKHYYQQLLVDYQDSYWTAQARINFRKLNSSPNTAL